MQPSRLDAGLAGRRNVSKGREGFKGVEGLSCVSLYGCSFCLRILWKIVCFVSVKKRLRRR